MRNIDVARQDDLIRALMAHPDNNMQSPLFALGYMTSLLDSVVRRLPQEQRDIIIADIDRLIDRHKQSVKNAKAGR